MFPLTRVPFLAPGFLATWGQEPGPHSMWGKNPVFQAHSPWETGKWTPRARLGGGVPHFSGSKSAQPKVASRPEGSGVPSKVTTNPQNGKGKPSMSSFVKGQGVVFGGFPLSFVKGSDRAPKSIFGFSVTQFRTDFSSGWIESDVHRGNDVGFEKPMAMSQLRNFFDTSDPGLRFAPPILEPILVGMEKGLMNACPPPPTPPALR